MKVVEKITFVLWLINIIGVILLPIIPVLYFTDTLSMETSNLILYIFWYPIVIFWIYNIWYCYKYDRYSSSIFFLFFLNAFYTPFYYYQVKIKKRPLRNEIDREKTESVFDKLVVEEEIEDKLEEETN